MIIFSILAEIIISKIESHCYPIFMMNGAAFIALSLVHPTKAAMTKKRSKVATHWSAKFSHYFKF